MRAVIDADSMGAMWLDKQGYLRHGKGKHVHITIVENAIGRKLKAPIIVHHVDSNRMNNVNSNLVVCPDQKYHLLLHARTRILDLGGHPSTHSYCWYHKRLHELDKFSTNPRRWNGLHDACREATNEYRKLKRINRGKFDWRRRLAQQYRRVSSNYTTRQISWLDSREACQ